MHTLRLAGVIRESVVDGPGWRFVVFAQGCVHKCKGCHNPATHDVNGGYETTIENLICEIKKDPLLRGVTFSGGEPFMQAEAFSQLAIEVHKLGLDVISFSGWTYEVLQKQNPDYPHWQQLLENIDYLIDGPFIEEQKSLSLLFRGSKNQRIIDVKASKQSGCVVETDFS